MITKLPSLHKGQIEVLKNLDRFTILCCGRRWGKDVLAYDIIIRELMIPNRRVAWIAPTYKNLLEPWRDITKRLQHMVRKVNTQEHRLEIVTNSSLTFWSLDSYESIRGRGYDLVIINEAASSRYLEDAFSYVIRPTLMINKGRCLIMSTPKGSNYFKQLYDKGIEGPNKIKGYKSFNMPSSTNPLVSEEELEDYKHEMPEIVYRQEYLAEFLEGDGTLVDKNDLRYFENINDLPPLRIAMAVDLAISERETAHYTAIVVLGKDEKSGNIYILEVLRFREKNFRKIIGTIESVYHQYRCEFVAIEKVAFQAVVIEEVMRTTTLTVKEAIPDKDKITRFYPVLSKIEHNMVYLNRKLTPEFQEELLSFPIGHTDDMVDAFGYCYIKLGEEKVVTNFFKT